MKKVRSRPSYKYVVTRKHHQCESCKTFIPTKEKSLYVCGKINKKFWKEYYCVTNGCDTKKLDTIEDPHLRTKLINQSYHERFRDPRGWR